MVGNRGPIVGNKMNPIAGDCGFLLMRVNREQVLTAAILYIYIYI
jgi:hypothetical protein